MKNDKKTNLKAYADLYKTKKALKLLFQSFNIKRFRPDSNWCRRFCRPLPSHSATEPFF